MVDSSLSQYSGNIVVPVGFHSRSDQGSELGAVLWRQLRLGKSRELIIIGEPELLLRGAASFEGRVAMRIAAKLIDDTLVVLAAFEEPLAHHITARDFFNQVLAHDHVHLVVFDVLAVLAVGQRQGCQSRNNHIVLAVVVVVVVVVVTQVW